MEFLGNKIGHTMENEWVEFSNLVVHLKIPNVLSKNILCSRKIVRVVAET